MEVNFSDFTTKKEVFNYLIDNSKKRVIKVEARLLDEDGVVIETSDDFLENCGDIKFYFDDDESLEINKINSVAIFVKGNGEKKILDYVQDDDFEPSFISQLNSELGLNFTVHMVDYKFIFEGQLPRDKFKLFEKAINKISKEFSVKYK